MDLSKHFSLSELARSAAAAEHGMPNDPPPAAVRSLRWGCRRVLEVLRARHGMPVRVTSGYRAPEVDRAVGGSGKGQHTRGEAADVVVVGVDRLTTWATVRDLVHTGAAPIDQAIVYEDSSHIHLSWSEAKEAAGETRGELLVALAQRGPRGERVYVPWATYRGALKPAVPLPGPLKPQAPPPAPPRATAPTPTPRTPDPAPPVRQEAHVTISPDTRRILRDKAIEEGRELIDVVGRAVADGDLDEDDASDFRDAVWAGAIDFATTALDLLTPLPGPWEAVADQALERLADRAKDRGPVLLEKSGRWLQALTSRKARVLVSVIGEIEEIDREDGVIGNFNRRAMYVACRRLLELYPERAEAVGITFAGEQLYLDGQPWGEPPARFRAPKAA